MFGIIDRVGSYPMSGKCLFFCPPSSEGEQRRGGGGGGGVIFSTLMSGSLYHVQKCMLILGGKAKVLEGLPQPPTITHQSPKDFIIDPRENIVIHCDAKGKPHPSFSWTRNGTHFDIDQDPKVTMRPHSGTLVVDISGEKVESYEGVYQCTARNEHGTAVSNNIVIRQSSKRL
ncbi:unnamed protein product [Oncorhynchus mykiss]|uniref:Ig-like domain-containing protein n=1 Tax=Oncorhynchus mykiss TaxID=8022 RepID=A0A061AEB4_ONCMY|nr:unnamed protein product [Oncorhynchus mykiss]